MSRRVSSLQRSLDRFVGIPLVAAFALAPKRDLPNLASVRRIGILKTAAIGDTLLLSGMLGGLRRRFPSASIVLITGEQNASATPLLGDAIDEHVVVNVSSPVAAVARVRKLELDILLECGPWPRVDALVAILSGARYRVGFRVAGQRRHGGFDRAVDHSSTVHQVENLRALARAVGATEFDAPALSPPPVPARDRIPRGRFTVFHPWSGGYMGHVKEWPLDNWVELGQQLKKRANLSVIVSGAPGDRERSRELVYRMNEAGTRATSIAGEFSLAELGAILYASKLVVSVNTGVMHLAALLGANTVSLEGPVAPHRWGPLGPRARSVVTTLPGCGYLDLGFEYANQRLDCMTGISVDAVLASIGDVV